MNSNLFEDLWLENQDLAIACLQHPFVQGIGDGSLPKSKFAYYVGQDAFFLEAFARAYSIAAAKVADWQDFNVFHDLADGVLQELKLHQGYANEWEVDLRQIEPGAATRRYTDFLASTAWSQEVGVTAIAMLPCMKLYAFLGQKLAHDNILAKQPDHAYSGWIQTYSSAEFMPLVAQLSELGDRYDIPTSLARSTYRYAMECELDFFQSAWES
ncbi:MAG: TenA family protein [Drouetiella hepatica Uher 2000/2452]|jgi:thiaminase/transcriptional activator TenA|uniref:TenA family protein n=1 Tax=Drouetiella hepatica Uher 2000/2452 TaxID=904376 RepID=A0A951QCY7_9CYAN|nr:TenA family protein [Drouetiella hepatica Uher 2000/2452]